MLALVLITLLDGSTIHLQTPEATVFTAKTPFGSLKIPIRDMRTVALGAHVEDERPYAEHAKNLGSENYNSRASASNFLKLNPRGAYKYLAKLRDSDDAEVSKRAQQLLLSYRDIPPLEDTINTNSGLIVGVIQEKVIKGKSEALGDVVIKLDHIKSIAVRTRTFLGSIKHKDGWVDFGIVAGKVKIEATGMVDLWPASPGQYLAGPNGHDSTKPQNSNYHAGALIGRLNGGENFLVGNFLEADLGVGRLELRINDSAWPECFPDGTYRVTVE